MNFQETRSTAIARRRPSARSRAALVGLAVALGGAGLALASTAQAAPKPHAPTAKFSWKAELIAPVIARKAPRNNARRAARISPTAALGGDSTVLLVTGVKKIKGKRWVRVLLPMRPNGRQGWVRASSVRLSRNPYRIEISLQQRRISVFRKGKRVMRKRIVIGRSVYPTPRGRHAVAETIGTNLPSSYLGPWVLPLTAYSEKLNFFAGGNGRVAIHGTSQPGLLGGAYSHGCVRMDNRSISRLRVLAKPGTPVTVR